MFHYTNEEVKDSLKKKNSPGSNFCDHCRWQSKGGFPLSRKYCSEPIKVLTDPRISQRLCAKVNPNHDCYLFELKKNTRTLRHALPILPGV